MSNGSERTLGFLKPMRYRRNGVYNCKTCEKNVYTGTFLDEMNEKLNVNKCIRIAYYVEGAAWS